jgi:hypothetical protein
LDIYGAKTSFMAETPVAKQSKSFWDILDILSKFTTGFLLVVIAFVLDIGSKRIAQSNEESKIIQSLIEDLTTKQAESRNDVALLSLEKYLVSKTDDKNFERNKAYITEVAETILRQRIHDDQSFSLESSIPFKIVNKYDTAEANIVLTEYTQNKRDSSIAINQSVPLTAAAVAKLQPIVQSKNATEANVISSFNKKICYIQYNDSTAADKIRSFQTVLKSKQWIAPGIDYVSGNYDNIVKYFNAEDSQLAEKCAALAKASFNDDFKIVPILSSKYKVPQGQLEVWINVK